MTSTFKIKPTINFQNSIDNTNCKNLVGDHFRYFFKIRPATTTTKFLKFHQSNIFQDSTDDSSMSSTFQDFEFYSLRQLSKFQDSFMVPLMVNFLSTTSEISSTANILKCHRRQPQIFFRESFISDIRRTILNIFQTPKSWTNDISRTILNIFGNYTNNINCNAKKFENSPMSSITTLSTTNFSDSINIT